MKVRVIPMLLVQDGLLKKPVRFKNPRTVANPISIARVFEERQVDELILVDRGASLGRDVVDPDLATNIAEQLFVPFTFGGGLQTVDQMRSVIQAGAEKVLINTSAVRGPDLVTKAASEFGSQCVVVSIDALRSDNSYTVVVKSGSEATELDAVRWARQVEELGAGELLVNSISHEGTMTGYDIDLISRITDSVGIPVIAAGGCGKLEDFVTAVKEGKASATAAASIFHYTKYTPNMVKGVMSKAGIPVRMYPEQDYSIT